MTEIIAAVLMLVGAIFCLLAAVGLVRLPDLFMRLQATTKASTLGVGALATAVALTFQSGEVTARALLAFAFLLITAPAGAHAIARAAHRYGVPLFEGTITDELTRDRDPDSEKA